MSILIGPVSAVGHPFTNTAYEVPVERMIGVELVYGFGSKWLYTGTKINPADPITAVVAWDPGWLRTDSQHEPYKLWQIAQELDVPVIGFFSDWFATWEGGHGYLGAKRVVEYLDAIIIDPAGAATMRNHPLLKVKDPADHRYRPIIEIDNMLSYGRLPRMGGDDELVRNVHVDHPIKDREIDVACVTHKHEAHVVNRSYFQEIVRDICNDQGYSYVESGKMTPGDMEDLYLNSKVVFNHSLGCSLNCRVFEAGACGAALLTDAHNIAVGPVPAFTYRHRYDIRDQLDRLLIGTDPGLIEWRAASLTQWVLNNHTPTWTWERNIDAINRAVALVPQSVREVRRDNE